MSKPEKEELALDTSPLVREATANDFLIEQKNQVIKQIVMLEIDIEVLSATPPNEIVATRKVTEQSKVGVTAKDFLAQKKDELSGAEKRLAAITQLLKKHA